MLAGLLIATHDAADRPATLTATLPFGGVTLIEYQARLLVAAGASQIVIVVGRLTPELLGSIARIGRRGVTVDTVRSAAEASEKLHPLARVLLLADGLTTTQTVVDRMAREGGDALLVVDEGEGALAYERVGGGMRWAGLARLDARRLGELAAMPRDYDVQSTLVHLASQAGAVHILLPQEAARDGHGIERDGDALAARGRIVLAAMVAGRTGWFHRLVVAPVARRLIPLLVPRGIATMAVGAGAAATGLVGLAVTGGGHSIPGLLLTLAGAIALTLAAILAELRDEPGPARWCDAAAAGLPAFGALLHGERVAQAAADGSALVAALALVAIAGLAERAIDGPRRTWWGSPPAYALLLLLGAIAGTPVLSFGLAGVYALATAAAAIERLRRQA